MIIPPRACGGSHLAAAPAAETSTPAHFGARCSPLATRDSFSLTYNARAGVLRYEHTVCSSLRVIGAYFHFLHPERSADKLSARACVRHNRSEGRKPLVGKHIEQEPAELRAAYCTARHMRLHIGEMGLHIISHRSHRFSFRVFALHP